MWSGDSTGLGGEPCRPTPTLDHLVELPLRVAAHVEGRPTVLNGHQLGQRSPPWLWHLFLDFTGRKFFVPLGGLTWLLRGTSFS